MSAETIISYEFSTGSTRWQYRDEDFQTPDKIRARKVSGERSSLKGVFEWDDATQRQTKRFDLNDRDADTMIDPATFDAWIDDGTSLQIKAKVIWIDEENVGVKSITATAKEYESETTNTISPAQYVIDIGVVGKEIADVFEKGKEENFEDGMISVFSKKLCLLIEKYSKKAVTEISHIILNNKVDDEVAYETLKWIGRVEHSESYDYRLWLLQKCLCNSSLYIRDAAALGIADMNDKKSIPSLEKAINCEKNSELKKDMVEVLSQLKE